MNIAIVGCGFVFDIYMRTFRAHPELKVAGVYDIRPERSSAVRAHYGFNVYESFEDLLCDESVDLVVNLTNIGSHYEVSRRSLESGKHVYSEKPLAITVDQCAELFSIARSRGLTFHGAPCNVYSDTVRTMFKAVEDGLVGRPKLVYAELDDNPIHLMNFEDVRSPTGAPWPLREEIYEGCTYEHVGYHLVWICALLGPAVALTAFSAELLEQKMEGIPSLVGTPDYSVACLHFASGATARITCSVVAPRDHRMRIIGDAGEIWADSYRHYRSPVYWERFSKRTLDLRKLRFIRENPQIARIFGVGGRKIPLVRHWKSESVERDYQVNGSIKSRAVEWVRRNQVYAQDKFVGIAEMARAINDNKRPYLTDDFLMHLNELTLLIQGAGPGGVAVKPTTSFSPLGHMP